MNWLLVARLAIVNIACVVLFIIGLVSGVVQDVLVKDTSYISIGIFCVFLFGLAVAVSSAVYISRHLNRTVSTSPTAITAMQRRLSARLATVNEIGSWLVMLGLIGTVIGFIQSLSGVQTDTALDASATLKMIVTLVEGMYVALYTTAVGSVLYLWLRFNYRIVANGATKLISKMEQSVSI